MVKNVFLDLDDTVMDFHRAEADAIRATFVKIGVPPTDETVGRYSEINRRLWEALERRELTREEVLVRRFSQLFAELGVNADAAKTRALYEADLATRGYLMDGAIELLDKLSGKYRLFLASNGTATVQAGRIKAAGIAHYFENIFVSQNIGADKPSAAFFDACFAGAPGALREESVMIGDSLTSDIAGGKNAGIRTVWFHRKNKPRREDLIPDYEITSLAQIPELLEKI